MLQPDNKICICTLANTSHPINKARSLIILLSPVLGSTIKSAHSTYLFIINFIKHHLSGGSTKTINQSFMTLLSKVKLRWHVRNANSEVVCVGVAIRIGRVRTVCDGIVRGYAWTCGSAAAAVSATATHMCPASGDGGLGRRRLWPPTSKVFGGKSTQILGGQRWRLLLLHGGVV
jgi:hypothetical protein